MVYILSSVLKRNWKKKNPAGLGGFSIMSIYHIVGQYTRLNTVMWKQNHKNMQPTMVTVAWHRSLEDLLSTKHDRDHTGSYPGNIVRFIITWFW